MRSLLSVVSFALALSLGGCIRMYAERTSSAPGAVGDDFAPRVSGGQARALVSRGALLLDVRSEGEYTLTHIDGADNIPVEELAARVEELGPDRDRPIVLYCMSGHRSSDAGRILRRAGFTHVYDAGAMADY